MRDYVPLLARGIPPPRPRNLVAVDATKSPVCPPGQVESAHPKVRFESRRSAVPLTQAQLVTAVADKAEMSKAEAKRAVEALEEIVLEQLGNAEKVRIGGIVQLTVRVKPATKKRTGRNPATGEEITIAAKPASVDVRARPLAKAKAALPSVQKARRRLAA
jgi:DNA-binding protein HU-beta